MKSFFSDRLALFTHIVVVLIASFLSVLDYEFTFLQILAGIVAVLVIEDTRSWNKFFISIFSILGAYYVGYLGLILIEYQPQAPIDWSIFRWLTISGVLTLLAYPFIPLIRISINPCLKTCLLTLRVHYNIACKWPTWQRLLAM